MPARRHSRNRRASNLARNVVTTVRENYWLFTTVALLLVITVVAYWNVAGPGFKACAVPDKVADAANYQKTISALDGVVDLSIKLSTALAGFGAAALIGLKSGIKLSPAVRLFILVATICFVQSALYAVWWRMGVAELWLNDCLSIIAEPRLTLRYDAHFYFFSAGLCSMALIIFGAAIGTLKEANKE
jgi:hypothetical protein